MGTRSIRAQAASQALVITCEHGGNRIPTRYRHLFDEHRALLESHRGFDRGALTMARAASKALRAPLLAATVSRMLVDLNRSIGHPQLHCGAIRNLSAPLRRQILARYYVPYRAEAECLVKLAIARQGWVVHLSCHSFTPSLDGKLRTADIGLLYDPARPQERTFCARWKAALEIQAPDLRVRRNYPYAGRNDGLTTWLRKRLPPDAYLGIELELNQMHVARTACQWADLRQSIIDSLRIVLAQQHLHTGGARE